jgi:hypothetical protein
MDEVISRTAAKVDLPVEEVQRVMEAAQEVLVEIEEEKSEKVRKAIGQLLGALTGHDHGGSDCFEVVIGEVRRGRPRASEGDDNAPDSEPGEPAEPSEEPQGPAEVPQEEATTVT